MTQSARVSVGARHDYPTDGASFTRNDINTPITLGVTGTAKTGLHLLTCF
jgi:hypothetical protein